MNKNCYVCSIGNSICANCRLDYNLIVDTISDVNFKFVVTYIKDNIYKFDIDFKPLKIDHNGTR